MWDLSDWGVFAVAEPNCERVMTYVYQVREPDFIYVTFKPNNISGPTASQVAVSKFAAKYQPVLVTDGQLTVQVRDLLK